MLSSEESNSIIDKYILEFLDSYEKAYGILPPEDIIRAWRFGFVSGCSAIEEAIIANDKYRS